MQPRSAALVVLGLLACNSIISSADKETLTCQEGGPNSGLIVRQKNMSTNNVHEIYMHSYRRDESKQREPRECWLTIKIISGTAVVVMEMQHEVRPVRFGDSMPFMIVNQTRNGSKVKELIWSATNITYIDARKRDDLYIQMNIDNATAGTMDNFLYLRILLINTSDTCRDRDQIFCDNSGKFYILRNESFIRGASLDHLAPQFSSIDDLQLFCHRVANSTGAFVKELKNSTFLIKNRCHNGELMYQNSLCQWIPVNGSNASHQCDHQESYMYVGLQVTRDGRWNIKQLSQEAAFKLKVLLSFGSQSEKAVNNANGGCNVSANWPPPLVKGDEGAGDETNRGNILAAIAVVVGVGVVVVGVVSIGITVCVKRKCYRRQSRNTQELGQQLEPFIQNAPNSDNGHQQHGDAPHSSPEHLANGDNGHQQHGNAPHSSPEHLANGDNGHQQHGDAPNSSPKHLANGDNGHQQHGDQGAPNSASKQLANGDNGHQQHGDAPNSSPGQLANGDNGHQQHGNAPHSSPEHLANGDNGHQQHGNAPHSSSEHLANGDKGRQQI